MASRSSIRTSYGRSPRQASWLKGLRTYVISSALAHLVWETLQLPLYTLWTDGSIDEQVFAIAHCTGGDILIAVVTLNLALILAGSDDWPHHRFGAVLLVTLFAGIAYTIFSEWLNISIRGAWEYSDLMPIVPIVGTGVSPLMQWMIIPTLALFVTRRLSRIHQLH